MIDPMPDRNATTSGSRLYAGGCHCGAVRYQAELDLGTSVSRCNCSMCTKTSASNVVVKPSAFRLVSGADSLVDYQREGNPNHFPFCKVCGIHAFGLGHLEEIGGDYYAVNVVTLDDVEPATLTFIYWDGRHNNWDAGPRTEPWPVRP